jgi:hypothetical protein
MAPPFLCNPASRMLGLQKTRFLSVLAKSAVCHDIMHISIGYTIYNRILSPANRVKINRQIQGPVSISFWYRDNC